MIEKIQIDALRFLRGATAGLRQKTALVTLRINGSTTGWLRNRQPATELLAEILPVQISDWQAPPSGTFADWIVSLTAAIMREAREAVAAGVVLEDTGERIVLALPYGREVAFKGALWWALHHLILRTDLATRGEQGRTRQDTYRNWLESTQSGGLAPNTLRFALAAMERNWPIRVQGGILFVGWGTGLQKLDSSFSGETSHLATRTARDKHLTGLHLASAGLPVPPSAKVSDLSDARQVARQLRWPVVVKPASLDQGVGVVPGICTDAALETAFDAASKLSRSGVIVEKHIEGDDYRLLVVRGRLLAATRRIPGGVVGDAAMSVQQLVDLANADPRRGIGKRSLMMQLAFDAEALGCLSEQGLERDSVPAAGQFVRLRRTANISTGGTAEDVGAIIHPDNRLLAERAARVIGLDIAGVDFLCPDITRSWHDVGGAICEVNAQPGFRPHWLGDPGRDINGEILDLLLAGRSPRIPTAAVTGTNGKSTTAKMLHHIWTVAGKVAGVCTSQGIWIGDDLITTQNLSGLPGANILLNDPSVESVVIELPRKGLIRFGHPCDRYDVAALLNIQDDHVGIDGIDTLEQMAHLKAEVLERATGAIVVNADDELCLQMRDRAGCRRHILVARTAENTPVVEHRRDGGEALFIAKRSGRRMIVLAEGEVETDLMAVDDIPATMRGQLRFNESNALFAAALAWAQGIPLATIHEALSGFHNSPKQNPGRYNFIDGLPFRVLLDYGHNPEGLRELFEIVSRLPVKGQRVLVSLVGNRFRRHLEAQVPWMLETFEQIYLSQDEAYFRNNSHGFGNEDPLGRMLACATEQVTPYLRKGQTFMTSRDGRLMLESCLRSGKEGDLLVILAEASDVLPMIERLRGGLASLTDGA